MRPSFIPRLHSTSILAGKHRGQLRPDVDPLLGAETDLCNAGALQGLVDEAVATLPVVAIVSFVVQLDGQQRVARGRTARTPGYAPERPDGRGYCQQEANGMSSSSELPKPGPVEPPPAPAMAGSRVRSRFSPPDGRSSARLVSKLSEPS